MELEAGSCDGGVSVHTSCARLPCCRTALEPRIAHRRVRRESATVGEKVGVGDSKLEAGANGVSTKRPPSHN